SYFGYGIACVLGLASLQASADAVHGKVWLGQPGPGANALIANAPNTAPDAEFDSGAINFFSQTGGYTVGGFLNHPVFTNTANPAAIDAADLNNTYFHFTGQTFLHAGANNFSTLHDDGFELEIRDPANGNAVLFDLKQPLPTAPVQTPYTVNAPADGL